MHIPLRYALLDRPIPRNVSNATRALNYVVNLSHLLSIFWTLPNIP